MSLPSVEVTDFSESVNFFQIPSGLSEHLGSLGLDWKLVSHDPRESPRRSGLGWRPVLIEDLPEELHNEILADFENPARHYGEIRRGDTRLVVRSMKATEQWERINKERALKALGQTDLAIEEVGAAAAKISRGSSVSPLFPGTQSHVIGGRSKAAAIRNDKALVDRLKNAAEE
jgi:hypothetical protein